MPVTRRFGDLYKRFLTSVDLREFSRFFITGITATIANLAVVWLLTPVVTYSWALAAGLMTGFTISAAMGKLFAFRSTSLRRAPGEMLRFSIVYAAGAALYWLIATVVGQHLLAPVLDERSAGVLGALAGAASMLVTSYFGHRYFTYAWLREPSP